MTNTYTTNPRWQYQHQWRENHREHVREYHKKYYEANKEKIKERRRGGPDAPIRPQGRPRKVPAAAPAV